MKKTIYFLLFILVSSSTFALSARLQDVKGNVRVKKKGGRFVKASEGAQVTIGTIIQSGFRSSATLVIGKHKATIKALTRVKLRKMNAKSGIENIGLSLRGGKIRAKVNGKAGKVKFRIKTPTATASVRGTEEEVSYGPAFGTRITVLEGAVLFEDTAQAARTVSVNNSSVADQGSRPTSPTREAVKEGSTRVSSTSNSDNEQEAIEASTEIAMEPLADEPIGAALRNILGAENGNVNVYLQFPGTTTTSTKAGE